jgi:hypothetical protein
VDGGQLRVVLLEEKLEFQTPYGVLNIPASEIRRIEFALRVTDAEAKKIDAAIANLGNSQYKLRESANGELLALRQKAFFPLQRAAHHKDPEIVHRAEALVYRLQSGLPAEQLAIREKDLIETVDSKFTGRLTTQTLRVKTAPFGEQTLRLSDLVSLRSAGWKSSVIASAAPDPGNLANFQTQVGRTIQFQVTGQAGGQTWGTDTYTIDSNLATACVHAGVLQLGETGVVRVTILPGQGPFVGSQRNGVSTSTLRILPDLLSRRASNGRRSMTNVTCRVGQA